MRFFLTLFFLILSTGCMRNNYVYWCEDHACSNDKERLEYFKKTMIVEIRDADQINRDEIISSKKKQAKIDKKNKKIEEKRLKKQARLEKKIRIQEEKELKENKKPYKANSDIKGNGSNDINTKEKKKKILKKKSYEGLNNFDEILASITNDDRNKNYPNINFSE